MARPKSNTSASYQYKILEIGMDYAKLSIFANEQSIASQLEDETAREEILELQQQLIKEMTSLADIYLTGHQKRVLKLVFEGKTQSEIGIILKCSQSAVHKAIHGNIDYKNQGRRYGGIVTRLRKLAKRSETVRQILAQIQAVKERDEI